MKSTNVPSDVYEDVKALDGHRCAWCVLYDMQEKGGLEFHHRLPRSRGRNLHDRWNGVMLCKAHHDMAHSEQMWPWIVPGYTLRGQYHGADPIYDAVYTPGATVSCLPYLLDLAVDYPHVPTSVLEWLLDRARTYLTLQATKG